MTILHLRHARTSLVLDARGPGLPRVVHWGGDVGDLDDEGLRQLTDATAPPVVPSSFDEPAVLSLLPEASAGWSGRPALAGHRDGRDWSTAFRLDGVDVDQPADATARVVVRASDAAAGLSLTIELTLTSAAC